MEKPDAELEITRDEEGRVTRVAFKVNVPQSDAEKARIEAYSLLNSVAEDIFASEGPEDHSVYVPVDIA